MRAQQLDYARVIESGSIARNSPSLTRRGLRDPGFAVKAEKPSMHAVDGDVTACLLKEGEGGPLSRRLGKCEGERREARERGSQLRHSSIARFFDKDAGFPVWKACGHDKEGIEG